MERFAITANGRCGTKFLANTMNMSPSWTVLHEPGGKGVKLEDARERFKRDMYGEVNGYLRFYFKYLEVEKKGVIIRNPRDILLSGINRNGFDKRRPLALISSSLKHISDSHDNGCFLICFENMVFDKDYLQSVLSYFGINDVDTGQIDLSVKVNASNGKKRWANLPGWYKKNAEKYLSWFAEKYEYKIEW